MLQRLEIVLALLSLGLGTLGIINLVLAFVFFGIAGALFLHLAIDAIIPMLRSSRTTNQPIPPVQPSQHATLPTLSPPQPVVKTPTRPSPFRDFANPF